MKRFLILSILAAIFGLTSCQKESFNPLLGTWEAKTIETTIAGFNMTVDLANAGMKGEVTFNEDGTGTAYIEASGEGQNIPFTYDFADDVLTYSSDVESGSTPVSIDGTKMTVELDGKIIGQTGTKITIHLEKK